MACLSGVLRLFTVPLFFHGIKTGTQVMELPPSWFVKASVIWGECLNYQGEPGWGLVELGRGSLPLPAPLGSLDTLPRSCSRNMAAAPSKPTSLESPTEK